MTESKPTQQIESVVLTRISPADWNPPARSKDIKSLIESMSAIGMKVPIIVQGKTNKANGPLIIVAGHRRYYAAIHLGWQNIDAIVLPHDYDKADLVTIVENSQRLQLTAMQEAEMIAKIEERKKGDASTDEIAAALGMSASHVARRSRLLALSDKWKGALSGKKDMVRHHVELWPVNILELVARYPHGIQDELFTELVEDRWEGEIVPNVNDVKKRLADYSHNLTAAPWPLDDTTIDPKAGACSQCPKRSTQQPQLFDDDEVSLTKSRRGQGAGLCLDSHCFAGKLAGWNKKRFHEVIKTHPNALLIGERQSDIDRYGMAEAVGKKLTEHYRICKPKDKGARQALMISGPRAGQLFTIQLLTSGSDGSKPTVKAAGTGKPPTEKERLARLAGRRGLWIVNYLMSHVEKLKGIPDALSRMPIDDQLWEMATVMNAFGSPRGGFSWKDWAESDKMKKTELVAEMWQHMRREVVSAFRAAQSMENAVKHLHLAHRFVSDVLGLKMRDLEALAAKEIPDRRAAKAAAHGNSKAKKK